VTVTDLEYSHIAKGLVETGLTVLINARAREHDIDPKKLLAHVYGLVGCRWIAGATSNQISETELLRRYRPVINGIKAEIKAGTK
jgi:hypothetical protein